MSSIGPAVAETERLDSLARMSDDRAERESEAADFVAFPAGD
jgi:hypothetical protein